MTSEMWKGLGVEVATVRDVINMWNPKLISIENKDYRGCPPATKEQIYLWYRGTDVLKTECDEIVVDGDIFRCTLATNQ